MEERPYPEGLDCVWIAADRDGRMGVFVTGGEGPIPAQALSTSRPFVEETESRLGEVPLSTLPKLLIPIPRPDDFLDFARRGFFAYDWTDVHRRKSEQMGVYEQIAAPETPMQVSALPKAMIPFVEKLVINVSFEQQTSLDVAQHFHCRRAGLSPAAKPNPDRGYEK